MPNPKPYHLQKVCFFSVDSPLLKYQKNIESQNGEDGIIAYIFSILPSADKKYCVEFGAWDGKYLSNCFNLVRNCGWFGLFIEANDEKFKQLLINHGKSNNVTCFNRFVEFEGPNRLDNIIDEADFPIDFDLLSVDIDGADYFVWESLQRFRPRVVIIEFNPSIPNDVIFVQAKDMNIHQGASLLALIMLGKQKGYELICVTECNAIFVLSEFYELFGLKSNHITTLYSPSADGRIFHGYDSYVYITGMPRLMWSATDVSSDDFQVLPLALRKWGDAQSDNSSK
jgi:hypothetical protein